MSDTPRTDAAWKAADGRGILAEVNGLDALCRQLEREVAELRSRLEMNGTPYDGIAARDETIRMLEKQVAELREQLRLANVDCFNTTAGVAELRELLKAARGEIVSQMEFHACDSCNTISKTVLDRMGAVIGQDESAQDSSEAK